MSSRYYARLDKYQERLRMRKQAPPSTFEVRDKSSGERVYEGSYNACMRFLQNRHPALWRHEFQDYYTITVKEVNRDKNR